MARRTRQMKILGMPWWMAGALAIGAWWAFFRKPSAAVSPAALPSNMTVQNLVEAQKAAAAGV